VISNGTIKKCCDFINQDPEKNFSAILLQLKMNLKALPGNPIAITK
jgi:hypothetical protein